MASISITGDNKSYKITLSGMNTSTRYHVFVQDINADGTASGYWYCRRSSLGSATDWNYTGTSNDPYYNFDRYVYLFTTTASTIHIVNTKYTYAQMTQGMGGQSPAAYKIPAWAPTTYTVTTSVPGGNGTISGNAGTYQPGATCRLTASPNSGYRLKNWTYNGRDVGSSNPYTFTVNGNTTITAVFEVIPIETVTHYFRLLNGGGVTAFTVYYYNSSGTYSTANIRSTSTTTITADASKSIKVGNISYATNYSSPWKIYYNLEGQTWRTDNVVSVSGAERTFSDVDYSRYIQIGATKNSEYSLSFDVSGVTTLYGYAGDTVRMPSASKSDSADYTEKYGEYSVYLNATDTSYTTLTANVYHTYYDSYSLAYWAVDNTHYRSGSTYTFPAADKTAIAYWTVTKHDKGWSSTSRVQLTTPSLTGYIFLGWYTASSGGTYVGKGGDFYTPTGNINLYAHWQVKPSRIPTFTWAKTPATGVKVSECITAAKWKEMQDDIDTINAVEGRSAITWIRAVAGAPITAAIVLQMRNAINACSGTSGSYVNPVIPTSAIYQGGTMYATLFEGTYRDAYNQRYNGLKDALNLAIDYYNTYYA